MNKIPTTFDRVFLSWLQMEIDSSNRYLGTAKSKGFNSVSEWRIASALRMGLDRKEWFESIVDDPVQFLPRVIIGPYQGWSVHFDNKLQTSFEKAIEQPQFLEWVKNHDRIPNIAEHFPLPSSVILLQKPNGELIHIEGGHRMCAVAYANNIGSHINFDHKHPVTAYIAEISDEEVLSLLEFLQTGTFKQK